jgi:hypothetical protein
MLVVQLEFKFLEFEFKLNLFESISKENGKSFPLSLSLLAQPGPKSFSSLSLSPLPR